MEKYYVVISRYNSVAVEVEADSPQHAEELAMETSLEGMFCDGDDQYEVVDCYISEDDD